MPTELKVPNVGESIQEVQIARWLKQEGEWASKNEDLVEIESEKATVEVPAPEEGFLQKIVIPEGEFANVGDVIALFEAGPAPEKPAEKPKPASEPPAEEPSPAARPATAPAESGAQRDGSSGSDPRGGNWIMPAAKALAEEQGINPANVTPSGPGGRVLKEDVLRHVAEGGSSAGGPAPAPSRATPAATPQGTEDRPERVVPMSILRRTISARLVKAQQTAALLTTFNEIDMEPVMELRKKYKDAFLEKHGVKLGFMSFFAKASVEALRRYPAVNAEIRGNDIVYKDYYDIGIAIGGGKGLVVPILRNCERLSFAGIEKAIGDFADRAQNNRLKPDELEGGTFTISNGGIYGSLLSTPIVNPPQSGILGLHAIQERPVAENKQVVVRPMMYIALTYDHRIVDGREAVTFLKTIKDVLEEPARLFLEV